MRADVALTERGLAPSRARAQALILAGRVFSGETRIDKAGQKIAPDTPLEVRGSDNPFVSRGGLKLRGALEDFELDVTDRVCADFGASTGGFTDCLLQRGAAKVYAIDVGYGQLHQKLRDDARVVVMERTNARHLKAQDLAERVSLVVIDASFIGLGKLLPSAAEILTPDGEIVAMVKPQFEVGRDKVGKGGVVRDDADRLEAIDSVARSAAALGFEERARTDSGVHGPKGNREAFLWLYRGAPHGG